MRRGGVAAGERRRRGCHRGSSRPDGDPAVYHRRAGGGVGRSTRSDRADTLSRRDRDRLDLRHRPVVSEELLTYWGETFDWREEERRLNQFDQYTTRIDGLDIHFIHQRSSEAHALPLLITHGWPSSIAEFAKIIGPLTDPVAHGGRAEDAFHVVAPSVPGYGFSDKPTEPGFGPDRIADINAELMARLGYERYGVQGGDFGSFISRWLAYTHATHVVGLHLNYLTGGPPPGGDAATEALSVAELKRMREIQAFMSERSGYQAIQGTKPQTLGYSLNDSPAGLVSWLLQIFRWCDCDGDIEAAFTKDELLTNATIYWATQTITSSTRLYYEVRHATPSGTLGRVEVPTAAAIFPYDVSMVPRPWADAYYNITRWTEMPHGGHFAALEQPDLLVDDLRAFFSDLRSTNNTVRDRP